MHLQIITVIFQNSTVCKECKSINTYSNPKIMKSCHTVENSSDLIMQKNSTFYHILTFLGNFCNTDKLSIFKQQHVDLQDKHGKGHTWNFYWKERWKTFVTNENIAPSEVTDNVEDERGDAFRGIPKLRRLSLPWILHWDALGIPKLELLCLLNSFYVTVSLNLKNFIHTKLNKNLWDKLV